MLFSVCITLYNKEDYIERSLESAINQDFNQYEILIINDGSTDNSLELVKKYMKFHDNIRIVNKVNKGLFNARITAVESALGEYIIFLDADDELEVNCLSTIAKYIRISNSDFIMYKYNIEFYNGKTKEIPGAFPHCTKFEGASKKNLLKRMLSNPELNSMCIKAIKKENFDFTTINNYGNITMGEDLVHSLTPITSAKSILYIDESLYIYKVNEESMIHKFDAKYFEKAKLIHEVLYSYMPIWSKKYDIKSSDINQRFVESIIRLTFSRSKITDENFNDFKSIIRNIRSDESFKNSLNNSEKLNYKSKVLLFFLLRGNIKHIARLKNILSVRR